MLLYFFFLHTVPVRLVHTSPQSTRRTEGGEHNKRIGGGHITGRIGGGAHNRRD